jgi:hypothetical protein
MNEIRPGDLSLDRLSPDELPRLAVFIAGYLHQDLAVVHGSAARAAYDCAAEAELDELEELAAEWEALRALSRRVPIERINDVLRQRFGSAWRATSRDEIDAVAREFELALRK